MSETVTEVVKMTIDICIPETRLVMGQNGKKYGVYTVRTKLNASNGFATQSSVLKRFQQFRDFDQDWKAVYSSLASNISLPSSLNVLKSVKAVTNSRQRSLEKYLQSLAEVTAVQPLLLQFVELSYNEALGIGDLDDAMRLSTVLRGGEQEEKMIGNLRVYSTKDSKMPSKATHGNNMAASMRANADKQAFIEKHKGLLESLLPGREFNLSFNTRSVELDGSDAKSSRTAGRVRLSLWFEAPYAAEGQEPNKEDDGWLHITIHQAIDLPHPSGAVCDPYIKLYLLPDPLKVTKQKTKVHRKNLSPQFEEGFRYAVPWTSLTEKELSITVWDSGLRGNSLIAEVQVDKLDTLPVCAHGEIVSVEPQWLSLLKPTLQEEMGDVHLTEGAVMEGTLRKRARQNRHLWQDRVFVLMPDALIYYKNIEDKITKQGGNRFAVSTIKDVSIRSEGQGSDTATRINLSLNSRQFELKAPTSSLATKWRNAIRDAMAGKAVAREAVPTTQRRPSLLAGQPSAAPSTLSARAAAVADKGKKLVKKARNKLSDVDESHHSGTDGGVESSRRRHGKPRGIVLEGQLKKKSTMSRHLWQLRYFVLTKNALMYFKSEPDMQAGGRPHEIAVKDVKEAIVAESGKGSDTRTRLNVVMRSVSRTFELMALSAQECQDWVDKINDIVEQVAAVKARKKSSNATARQRQRRWSNSSTSSNPGAQGAGGPASNFAGRIPRDPSGWSNASVSGWSNASETNVFAAQALAEVGEECEEDLDSGDEIGTPPKVEVVHAGQQRANAGPKKVAPPLPPLTSERKRKPSRLTGAALRALGPTPSDSEFNRSRRGSGDSLDSMSSAASASVAAARMTSGGLANSDGAFESPARLVPPLPKPKTKRRVLKTKKLPPKKVPKKKTEKPAKKEKKKADSEVAASTDGAATEGGKDDDDEEASVAKAKTAVTAAAEATVEEQPQEKPKPKPKPKPKVKPKTKSKKKKKVSSAKAKAGAKPKAKATKAKPKVVKKKTLPAVPVKKKSDDGDDDTASSAEEEEAAEAAAEEKMSFCGECGTPALPNTRFCLGCGMHL